MTDEQKIAAVEDALDGGKLVASFRLACGFWMEYGELESYFRQDAQRAVNVLGEAYCDKIAGEVLRKDDPQGLLGFERWYWKEFL
jgi:hypothetical protein